MYQRKKGFTLIELLVVISIIALLLSIMMPALKKAKEKAKDVICRSRQHQQGIMFLTYAADNDGRFPPHDNVGAGYVKDVLGLTDMTQLLDEYADKSEIFYCPLSQMIRDDYISPGGDYVAWRYKDEPAVRYVEIGYLWHVNFQLGIDSKRYTYHNGFKFISRMSEANSRYALGSDRVKIYPPYFQSGETRDPFNWEFRQEDSGGIRDRFIYTGVWMEHPWGVGGINVLGGDGSVAKHSWTETKVRYHRETDITYY